MSIAGSRLILLMVFLLDLGFASAGLAGLRRRAQLPRRLGSCAYLLLAAAWVLITALDLHGAAPPTGLARGIPTLLGFGFLPFLWLFLVLLPSEPPRPPSPWFLLLLLEPALFTALAWTAGSQALPALPWIDLQAGLALLLVLSGTLILILRRREPSLRPYPAHPLLLLAAGLPPWLSHAAARLDLVPGPPALTPLACGVSALLLVAFLFPRSGVHLRPFAYETIVNSMRDPVIVMDRENCILASNAAASALLAAAPDQAHDGAAAAPLTMLNARVTERGELIINRGGEARAFDMGLSPLMGRKNNLQGRIMVLRDISERKATEGELRALNARIKRDLERAVRLQDSLLPRAFLQVPGVRFDWIFEPCDELAGDLFNIFRLDEGHVGFYLLDVSGHGLVAALLSFALARLLSPLPDQSSLLKRRSSEPGGKTLIRPVEVAETLNRQFPFDADTEQYFSLFYGIYNFETRLLSYVSAGHGGFAYLPRGGKAKILAAPSFPIGFHPEPGYREERLQVRSGDRIFLYSDGITELLNPRGAQFGTARLLAALAGSPEHSLRQSLQALLSAGRRWGRDSPRNDDISILGFEVEAGPD